MLWDDLDDHVRETIGHQIFEWMKPHVAQVLATSNLVTTPRGQYQFWLWFARRILEHMDMANTLLFIEEYKQKHGTMESN